MSNSQVIFSPITGLSTINSDNVLTNGLSSVEQDTELIKINVMDNFNSAFVTLKSTIIPDVTNSYTLGTTLLRFSDIYTGIVVANAVSFTNLTITGTLDVNGATTLDQTTIDTTDGDFKVWNGSSSLIVADTNNVTLSGNFLNLASDITQFKDSISSNRYIRGGTGSSNHYQFQYITNGADTNLDYVLFRTISADEAEDKGKLLFEIDDDNVVEFNDGGVDLYTGYEYLINNVSVLSNNTLGSGIVNSSPTGLGTISSGKKKRHIN
jgi:hypothetical protein